MKQIQHFYDFNGIFSFILFFYYFLLTARKYIDIFYKNQDANGDCFPAKSLRIQDDFSPFHTKKQHSGKAPLCKKKG